MLNDNVCLGFIYHPKGVRFERMHWMCMDGGVVVYGAGDRRVSPQVNPCEPVVDSICDDPQEPIPCPEG